MLLDFSVIINSDYYGSLYEIVDHNFKSENEFKRFIVDYYYYTLYKNVFN